MRKRFPDWLVGSIAHGKEYFRVLKTLEELNLNTVCEEARCPNRGECYAAGTATFLIMGDNCTRNCRFCAIEKGIPLPLDPTEPKNIAKAVKELGLKYVVVTSVTRDDLADGGAAHFAQVIREIRWENAKTKVEVLIPDFQGSAADLQTALNAHPDVLSHNIETVPRLYSSIVRPKADYQRSLQVLSLSKIINPKIPTKSGLMLGLGEKREEIIKAMRKLRMADCDLLTLGQYLAPSRNHLPVKRFIPPEEFKELKETALELGFKAVASGPMVRSSYLAEELLEWRNKSEKDGSSRGS